MAKKVLTPEQQEIKSMKKAKKSQNWTKFWAVVLALVLTLGIAYAGKSQGANNASTSDGSNVAAVNPGSNADPAKPSEEASLSRGEDAVSEGQTIKDADGNEVVGLSKADAVKLLNDATAVAAKGAYDWKRTCDYTSDGGIKTTLDSNGKDATSTLDGIIKKVDENASLGGVVGGFIGIGTKEGKAQSGKFVADAEGKTPDEKYLLKAMKLTEADVKDFVQEGSVYKFQLNTCSNPQKDNQNALHHATNDFITHDEVSNGIKDALGSFSSLLKLNSSDVTFSNITISAKIVNGKLENLEMSYTFAATLGLKATLVGITGTGKADTKMTYSNIA